MRILACMVLMITCCACNEESEISLSKFRPGDAFEGITVHSQENNGEYRSIMRFMLLEDNIANVIVGENSVLRQATWFLDEDNLMIYQGEQNVLAFQAIHRDTLKERASGERWIRVSNVPLPK